MTSQTRTITFANTKFLPVLLNWFLHIRRQRLPTPATVALDEPLHRYLTDRGFPSIMQPHHGSRNKLWELRTKVFSDLLDSGRSFLHSDADAVWLGNPWLSITASDADITLSQGTIWPPDVVAKRGFVACCGFFHAKSNERTKNFFRRLASQTAMITDDQVSLNRLLDEVNVTWEHPQTPADTLSYQGIRFNCFKSTIFGQSQTTGLTVALLPHSEYQRLATPSHPATVKHPIKPDQKEDTQTHLQKQNCWILREDWQQLPFNEATLEVLMKDELSPKTLTNLPGQTGGAWTAETHKRLYPAIFNQGLAGYITRNFNPNTVLEFGSGLGDLARFIADNSACKSIHCIEPLMMPEDIGKHPKITQFTTNIFRESKRADLRPKYDLVLSIEVAEHVERSMHNILFDFLVKRCEKWLVFSAARVGQGGHGHIAERPEEEWRSEIVSRGLHFREDLTLGARNASDRKNINHCRNVMVFERPSVY